MTKWTDRLRIALILSPALLLLHVWMLACSNGYLVQTSGLAFALFLAVISSLGEAYIIVLALTAAISLWREK
jgi:hypothetical protein